MGDLAYETLAKDAKDPGFEDDAKTMPNMTMLYEGASRAAQTMWNGALSKLTQRRIFKGIKSGALGETPQISEGKDTPNCDVWAQKVSGAIAKSAQGNPDLQKSLTDDMNRMKQQCQQMSNVAWNKIDPRFEANDKGGGGQGGGNGQPQETLQFKGPEKEDSFQRDLRNQLEVLNKAGKNVQQLQTNWKYDKKDEQSTLKEYDTGGQEVGNRTVTVEDQLNAYKGQLEEAAKGMEEVQARYPDYKPDTDATLGYAIAPNTRSVMDIDRPTQTMMEEFNANAAPSPTMSRITTSFSKAVEIPNKPSRKTTRPQCLLCPI